MRPDDISISRNSSPRAPERSLPPVSQNPASHSAAANLIRDKIDTIYDGRAVASSHHDDDLAQPSGGNATASTQPQLHIQNPYDRTHTKTIHPQADQWQQYHSAWQSYYQKYYERYYINQVHETTKKLQDSAGGEQSTEPASPMQPQTIGSEKQGVSREEAIYDLRMRLTTKVRAGAKKARSSRHFIPLAAALAVVLLFGFLQYNRVLIANVKAYVSPGNIDPQNIIVDPSVLAAVGPEPQLIIPKINVDVPVIYGVGYDNDSQLKAMESGVAHFSIPGANSVPGQVGNTVISGHSSNDLLDPGDYKFIFAQLEKLTTGDMIYANYEGVRYSYTVTSTEVVMPTDVSKLIYDTDKPILTLITCTPLGTADKRLLVTAEQVSPDPAKAAPVSEPGESGESVAIPGNSPTLLERIFR